MSLTITEYSLPGRYKDGQIIQAAEEPALAITHYATAVLLPQLHQFNSATRLFRIYTDAYIEFRVGGATVSAKTSDGSGVAAGQTEYWPLSEGGLYISLYDGAS